MGEPSEPFAPARGRDREFARLRLLAADVENGAARCVALVGLPGSGRSRLLREIAAVLLAGTGPWSVHRADFRDPAALEPPGGVLAEARSRPVLLDLDGADWHDSDTAARLVGLPDRARGCMLLALSTAAPPFRAAAGWESVLLPDLGEADIAQIAADRLGAPPDPRIAERLVHASGGIPGLAVDVLEDLLRDGLPPAADPRFATALSPRLHGSLRRLLGPVPPDVRPLLLAAAAFGGEARGSRIASLLDAGIALPLEAAIDLDLLRRIHTPHRPDDPDLALHPPALWAALLDSLPDADRRRTLLAAAAILKSPGPDPPALAAAAALHEESGDIPGAAEAWVAAAEAAVEADAFGPALEAAGAALRLGRASEGRAARSEALLALLRTGEAREEAEQTLQIATDPDIRARMHLVIGSVSRLSLRLAEAAAQMRAAADRAASPRLRVEAGLALAYVLAREGRSAEAGETVTRAVRDADGILPDLPPRDAARLRSRCDAALADVEDHAGRTDAAIAHIHSALSRVGPAASVILEGDLRRVLSSQLRKAGRLDDALEHLHLALAAYRLAGDRQRAAITRAAHARIILDQGNPGRALSELTEALAIQREVPFTQFTSQTLSDISLARMALGHYDDADAAIREAIELSRGTDQVSLRIAHLRQRASIAGKRGDYAFASAALAEAIDLARTSGNPRVLPSLLNNLANTQVRSGHWENALRSYEEAVSCARDGGDPGPLSVFLSNVGTVSMRLGDTARARRSMEEARSLLDDRSAKARIADLLHMEAQIDLLEGALVPAGRRLRESLAAARSAGDRRATGQVLTELAELRRVEGDLRGAEEAAAEAAQILLAIGEGSAGGPVSVRACVALAEGRMKDASRLADAALEVSARTAADSDDATAARLCVARAALALGDPARARAAVLPPLASLQRRSDAHFLAIVELLLSRAERLLGNRDAADALLAGGLRGMDDGRTPFLVRMDCAREGIEGLCEAGRRGEAEALLERAALEAEAAGALGLAGELEDALGRHEKASE